MHGSAEPRRDVGWWDLCRNPEIGDQRRPYRVDRLSGRHARFAEPDLHDQRLVAACIVARAADEHSGAEGYGGDYSLMPYRRYDHGPMSAATVSRNDRGVAGRLN